MLQEMAEWHLTRVQNMRARWVDVSAMPRVESRTLVGSQMGGFLCYVDNATLR